MRLTDRYREAIEAAIASIPLGRVSSYGAIARQAGIPGRARLVARLLSENDRSDLPWHRVLRADGRIAFPSGSQGFREQSKRLRAEGVTLKAGRVISAHGNDRDLDQLLWG